MSYIAKRHIIKIPKNISIYYCDVKHILILANSSIKKTLILKTKVIIDKEERLIKITRDPFFDISTNEKKN